MGIIVMMRHIKNVVLLCFFLLNAGSVYAIDQQKLSISKNIAKLNSDAEVVIARTPDTTYVSRIKATHHLGGHLGAAEITELYAFLHRQPAADPLINNLEFNAVKNEVVVAIMDQTRYPAELTQQLAEMYHDKTLGITWRDYCIQFLGQWYPKVNTDKEKDLIVKTITAAFQEKNNGIAGTALISASKLVDKSEFKRDQVSTIAQALAEDCKADHITRVPALQISAKLGNPQAIITARDIIANHPEVPVMLKMSALAVLGMNGNSSDMETLKRYQNSSDVRLRAAATAAIHRLTQKKQ